MKRYPLKWFNIVFLMLASACVKANGEADGVTVAQRDEISVTILESGHIVVPVIANDAVGGSFIFDTGGGIELVSTCFYEKIKAQSTRAGIFTCFRSDGERVDVDTYLIPSLQIGQLTRRNVLVGVFPLLDTIGIDGILSCKFFESIAATIDFKNQTLTIEDERSIDEISKTGTIIPIFIQKLGRNGLDIFIDIWVNDRVRIFCEFDTGHGFYPLWMNSYYANRIQGNISPSGTPTVDKISIDEDGRIALLKPEITLKSELIYEGLIGAELFREGKLSIDIPNDRLIYRK